MQTGAGPPDPLFLAGGCKPRLPAPPSPSCPLRGHQGRARGKGSRQTPGPAPRPDEQALESQHRAHAAPLRAGRGPGRAQSYRGGRPSPAWVWRSPCLTSSRRSYCFQLLS